MATTVAAGAGTASSRYSPLLKEALLAAFVAFVLLAPLLGMRTTSGPGGMTLTFRFGEVLIATGIVFIGPNPGAIAAMGDVFGVLGSAVALIPGPGTAAGSMVSGIGAVISAIGGFVGDAIDKHQTREAQRGYMEAAGVDPVVIDAMAACGVSLAWISARKPAS